MVFSKENYSADGELVVWVGVSDFLGSPYERDCYFGVPRFESQTTLIANNGEKLPTSTFWTPDFSINNMMMIYELSYETPPIFGGVARSQLSPWFEVCKPCPVGTVQPSGASLQCDSCPFLWRENSWFHQDERDEFITRRWQLKHFLCSPRTLGKWSNLSNIFQLGWNHQLVNS